MIRSSGHFDCGSPFGSHPLTRVMDLLLGGFFHEPITERVLEISDRKRSLFCSLFPDLLDPPSESLVSLSTSVQLREISQIRRTRYSLSPNALATRILHASSRRRVARCTRAFETFIRISLSPYSTASVAASRTCSLSLSQLPSAAPPSRLARLDDEAPRAERP